MTYEPAAVVETHVSTLFFADDVVVKRKKPVRNAFIDLSTVELRRTAVEREVTLNRRIAPDVYRGVAELVLEDGTAEPLVLMHRLPSDRRLATLVTDCVAGDTEIDDIARVVATFHAGARRSPEIDAASSADALLALWEAGIDQLGPYRGSMLDAEVVAEVGALAREYVEGRRPLIQSRIEASRACDGHGDLQAADIFCMDDGPRILDCLEFDDDLRYGDVLADVAFLAMDLERLGAPELARRFLHTYQELSGDTWPASLAHHHIAYRAFVRAKVACIRADQGDSGAPREARAFLAQCHRHLLDARPVLVLVGGNPGTGKTSVATAVADALGAVVLCSDELRKDLAGIERTQHGAEGFGVGLYSPEQVDRVYRVLLEETSALLAHGERVVLDATWLDPEHRERARWVAVEAISPIVELRTTCEDSEAERRIEARQARGTNASDATVAVARELRDAPPWTTATDIDTNRGVGDAHAAALAAIRRALAERHPHQPKETTMIRTNSLDETRGQ